MRTRFLSRASLVASIAVLSLGSAAQADRVDFTIFENATGADVSELDLWLDVLPAGSDQIDFVFHNDSTISAVVTSVYFEDSDFAALALSMPRIVDESSGVSFSDDASPAEPAGSVQHFGGVWTSLYSAGADTPSPFNGINAGAGETLTIRFDLAGSTSVQDVIDAIVDDPSRLRITQHIQSLPSNASVWSITVPSPGSLALLSAGLLLVARRRR